MQFCRSDVMGDHAFGYTLERQEDGWWLVHFPGIPEALTEGEMEEEPLANGLDCVIMVLEGYMKAGKSLPREGRRTFRVGPSGTAVTRGAPYGTERNAQETSIKSEQLRLPAARVIPPGCTTGNMEGRSLGGVVERILRRRARNPVFTGLSRSCHALLWTLTAGPGQAQVSLARLTIGR